ncbi:MAG: UDP-N-acetylmuramoyl-L-alanine--D-glutamate ligase [Hyphomonadaceae bacterium]|nr:UDP-N-acetylmuramoyl-L-alanine--D-glutamate ligase [Clostridia bacterium]
MNEKLLAFQNEIRGKRVAVIGVGVSNTPLIRLLVNYGAIVTACDKKDAQALGQTYSEFEALGITFQLGENYLENLDHAYIFKTPGMRHDTPELVAAQARGSIITSEMEVFLDLCPAQVIAVSGSDGKTTTTSLIYTMLKTEGYTCWLGGNIGNPLLGEIELIQPIHKVILELSSFQLQTIKKSADIAVITNVTPNHLDWHTNMAEYVDAKRSLFAHQSSMGKLVVNADNEITRNYGNEALGNVVFFSKNAGTSHFHFNEKNPYGLALQNDRIVLGSQDKIVDVLDTQDIFIPGAHNVENYMAAIAAVWGMVQPETIVEVAKTFQGVEHRIEFVREIDGVRFFNDSIASSPTRSIAGLNSFNSKVILIAGGYDKHIPFDDYGKVIVEKVKKLVLIGKTTEDIERAVLGAAGHVQAPPIIKCISLDDAVQQAYKESEAGDIITLSPACASFDMFDNFEVRGNKFKEIVNAL